MPHTSYKTTIQAPYERVYELLLDKMDWPRKYVGVISHSSVLERGDGYTIREMYQPQPVGLTIKEKIYHHDIDGGHEFVYEHVDNASYTGTFRNVLTRLPGDDSAVELEYVQAWDAHPGTADPISDGDAERAISNGVEHLKALAEHPVVVPHWVRAFFDAVDSMDAEALRPLLAPDVTFRMGNAPEVLGSDAVVAGSKRVASMFEAMTHDYVAVNEDAGRTFAECWVTYWMLDGSIYLLPFMTVLERKGDLISGVRIFGDLSPLRDGWPS